MTIDVNSQVPLSQSVDYSYPDRQASGTGPGRRSPMSMLSQNICDKSIDGGLPGSKISRNFLNNITQADTTNSGGIAIIRDSIRESISGSFEPKAIGNSLQAKPIDTRRTDAYTALGRGSLEIEDSKDLGFAQSALGEKSLDLVISDINKPPLDSQRYHNDTHHLNSNRIPTTNASSNRVSSKVGPGRRHRGDHGGAERLPLTGNKIVD